jgi:hypothetical protein
MAKEASRGLLHVQACIREEVRDMLDDPFYLTRPDNDISAREALAELRVLARDVGYDFDLLIAEMGSPEEKARLKAIENGQGV